MPGVVADEKLIRFASIKFGFCCARNMSCVLVLAVPSAPMPRTTHFRWWMVLMTCCAWVESMVGTRRFNKSSFLPSGYIYIGGFHFPHSPVVELTIDKVFVYGFSLLDCGHHFSVILLLQPGVKFHSILCFQQGPCAPAKAVHKHSLQCRVIIAADEDAIECWSDLGRVV